MDHFLRCPNCGWGTGTSTLEDTEVGSLELTQFDETVRAGKITERHEHAGRHSNLVAPDGTIVIERSLLRPEQTAEVTVRPARIRPSLLPMVDPPQNKPRISALWWLLVAGQTAMIIALSAWTTVLTLSTI